MGDYDFCRAVYRDDGARIYVWWNNTCYAGRTKCEYFTAG